ncbi:succinate-semialdehyde dehydrogenase / glutarate-semialdehyde dehydrogenase [Pricia antarctica]|uniref:Succinate-semialdehyde dehydrogenase / glutarate-semialdehyde dehydrogenase n=1 Tax=Pricia antarctica TaxID=641691 RepID=A0A1G7CT39_9FLAO|nr:aldehyde dehydrogenase family protein [Pricia antarctica]SDE42594.1 succinate-semialdehyde dehydrogenase / glutarate-semialdehyde dehydrogenase [Pricia antarctica]
MKAPLKFGHKKLYIDGELVEASNGKTFEVICPADELPTATIAWASNDDTERALQSAQKGFQHWSKLPLHERLDWIDKLRNKIIKNSDLLRESIMYEMGKTWEGSEEDLTSITNSLQYYSEEIQKRNDIPIEDKEGTHEHLMVSQPLGVAVAFLAYNFPLLNLGFKLGPALAAGSCIIIKPSEFSPLSAYIIGELCAEINFPKGVVTVLCGDLHEVGIPLCESTIPRLITMIGSTETAQKLIAQSARTSIKRYSMECGGNAPFIVCEDADMELAVNIGAALKIGNSGQICVAPNRFFIHESVIDRFMAGMKEKFENAKIGFGRENKPDMGPLANAASVTKVHGIVKEAVKQGGKLIYGGKPIDGPGYYFEPTAIRLNNNNAEILQHEIFGPVALISSFKTIKEVIGLANNTNAGLASYVFSKNEDTLNFFAENLEFGEVQLNGVKYDIYLPHGGVKNSGIGFDCSTYALDDYLVTKRVTKTLSPA